MASSISRDNVIERIMRFRKSNKDKVYDILSMEFKRIADKITDVVWDFTKLISGYDCCVEGCSYGRLYGHWTCQKHLDLELKHFNPVDEFGHLFWSHKEADLKS